MTRPILRGVAMLIAAAGAADPTLMREVPVEHALSVVAIGDEALGAAQEVRGVVGSDAEPRLRIHREPSRAAACPLNGSCLVVSSGETPGRVTAGATVLGAVEAGGKAKKAIVAIDAPARASLHATSLIRVTLSGTGKRVEVFDEDVRVGFADRQEETFVSVPWVPLSRGARALRVKVDDEVADFGVVVSDDVIRVLFHEPQTTWPGTFVRRALADDVRFQLEGRTQVAPPVAIRRGAASLLTAAALEHVGVVVVTAPDALGRADVDLLNRFVRQRGGSVLVILDRRPVGPVLELLPRIREERRQGERTQVSTLQATELVSFETGEAITTLAMADDDAVVVARALGSGRVIVSGALDAWKYRDANDAFASYWQAVVWDAAVAAGQPLRVTTQSSLVRPHEPVHVEVELQTLRAPASELESQGRYDCGSDAGVVRLWPEPRPGTFRGTFYPRTVGECQITVAIDGRSATTPILVKDGVRSLDVSDGRLAGAVAAHGGIVVSRGHEKELLSRLPRPPQEREPTPTYPMRSPWWVIPFVACLGGEWLLRRRADMR